LPDICVGERVGAVLLIGEQEQGNAQDLRRREDRVCSSVAGVSQTKGSGEGDGCRTEALPALAQALAVVRIDDVDDGVAVTVVFRPYGADAALAAEIPELEYCRGQRDLPDCARRT